MNDKGSSAPSPCHDNRAHANTVVSNKDTTDDLHANRPQAKRVPRTGRRPPNKNAQGELDEDRQAKTLMTFDS